MTAEAAILLRASVAALLCALSGCTDPAENSTHEATGTGSVESSVSPPSTDGGETTTSGGADSTDDGAAESSDGSSSGGTTQGSSTGDLPTDCEVATVVGQCADFTECAGSLYQGLCGGPPSTQCCVDVEEVCSVDGAPGACMDVAQCPLRSTAGQCDGPANVQCCTDPASACDPMAAPTPNDGLTEERFSRACPLGMIASDDFCIDRYEASLVELDGMGGVVGSWSPYHTPGTTSVRAVSLEHAIPQGYISGTQAAAACTAAGKQLCTDAQWLRACQGAAGTTFPYGDTLVQGTCNDARAKHPVIEYFGTAAEWIWSELGHPCISQLPESLAITGQHEQCVTQDGAFDMVGNLHEWTSDPAGTFRGGFYVDTALNGPGCLYATTAHNTEHWDYSTGFRCCADPL